MYTLQSQKPAQAEEAHNFQFQCQNNNYDDNVECCVCYKEIKTCEWLQKFDQDSWDNTLNLTTIGTFVPVVTLLKYATEELIKYWRVRVKV